MDSIKRPPTNTGPDSMAYYMYPDTSAQGSHSQLSQFQSAAHEMAAAHGSKRADKPAAKATDKVSLTKDGKILVIWNLEEDEQLRDLVGRYGTQKWAAIAGKMAEKTSKQCRRRWQIIMNLIGKKGGWSEEEDRLLLEGHRSYGNRWTEIAKLVPGRTDNAVKNRYCALAKKLAEGDKPGKRKRRKRATIEHKAPEGMVVPYPGAVILKTKLEPKGGSQEGGEGRSFSGPPKRKNPTAYERQRNSEMLLEDGDGSHSMHWQTAAPSRGGGSGRYRPPQNLEQRTQALVAELFGESAQMRQEMEMSEGNFGPETELSGGAYQRLLYMEDGNGSGRMSHQSSQHSHQSSYYQQERYHSRGGTPIELAQSDAWYAHDAPRGTYQEYEHGFHPGSGELRTPRGRPRGTKRQRVLTPEDLQRQRQNSLQRAASQFNARAMYNPQEGGRSKPLSRPTSSKTSPGGKGSRSYPTQLQHALASLQRAKAQKISPGRLATEQASRVKRKYTRRELGVKTGPPGEELLLARVQKSARETELVVGALAAAREDAQGQPKRPRPSLSIHIPRSSGNSPTSPPEAKPAAGRPLSSARVGPSRLNPETLHKLPQHGVKPRVTSAMRRNALALERGIESRELVKGSSHRQAQSHNDMQEIISWMSTPKAKSYFHQYITPGFENSPTFVGSGISSAPPSLNLTPTSACGAADGARSLAWEDRFWGASRRQIGGAPFLADESDGVLLYTDRGADGPCFRLSPLAFQPESSPGFRSPGSVPSVPRSPTVGALPLPKPSLPKLNTPGQSPGALTTPKLLSVFSPMLGASLLTPRRLFFEPGSCRFGDMENKMGLSPRFKLSPRIMDVTEDGDSTHSDTGFTFPKNFPREEKDGVNASDGNRHAEGNVDEGLDTKEKRARGGSSKQGLVSEGVPGLLALPEVADEAEGDAKRNDADQTSPYGMLAFSGLLSPPVRMSIRTKSSPRVRTSFLSLTPRNDALPSPGFPEGEDDFFFSFSQNMSPLQSPRFLSPAASPLSRAVLGADVTPRSLFKTPTASGPPALWRSASLASPVSAFLSRKAQQKQSE